jgi:uncharacterized protein (UPF0335 family)
MSNFGDNSAARLRSLVERIENLEDERKLLQADIKDIYTEAKSAGYDAKVLRMVIAARKKDQDELNEQQALLETYMRALGMLADTPLGQAALEAANGP